MAIGSTRDSSPEQAAVASLSVISFRSILSLNTWRLMMRVLLAAILMFPFPVLLYAQVGTATLSGTVMDATGAVIAGAEVVLDHADQQLKRSTLAGSEGQYVIPAIPPGSYKLTVRKEGFRDSVNTFPLSTGQASTLDVTLQLATSTERVEVREAPP